jgi:transposase
VDDRAALSGIIFVLKSGIPWEMLPQEMGCGSGVTCWRRLREWQQAGVWERLHQVLLDRLGQADQIEWERACLDSASIPAKRGATKSARIRRIRKRGLEAPRCGRPRRHPALGDPLDGQHLRLQGPQGGSGRHLCLPQAFSWTTAQAPQRATLRRSLRLAPTSGGFEEEEHNPSDSMAGHRLQRVTGRIRVVERTLLWMNRFRRLKVRYERRDDIHQAFLDLGCALICWRYVRRIC